MLTQTFGGSSGGVDCPLATKRHRVLGRQTHGELHQQESDNNVVDDSCKNSEGIELDDHKLPHPGPLTPARVAVDHTPALPHLCSALCRPVCEKIGVHQKVIIKRRRSHSIRQHAETQPEIRSIVVARKRGDSMNAQSDKCPGQERQNVDPHLKDPRFLVPSGQLHGRHPCLFCRNCFAPIVPPLHQQHPASGFAPGVGCTPPYSDASRTARSAWRKKWTNSAIATTAKAPFEGIRAKDALETRDTSEDDVAHGGGALSLPPLRDQFSAAGYIDTF
jgi:hypothetical protein